MQSRPVIRDRRQYRRGTFEGGDSAVLGSKPPLSRIGRVTDIASLAVFLCIGRIRLDYWRSHSCGGWPCGGELSRTGVWLVVATVYFRLWPHRYRRQSNITVKIQQIRVWALSSTVRAADS